MDRITDFNDLKPESFFVKQMCLIALARMNAVDHGPTLRELIPKFPNPPGLALALRWSIRKLTGEEFPPPELPVNQQMEWFLEPLKEAAFP